MDKLTFNDIIHAAILILLISILMALNDIDEKISQHNQTTNCNLAGMGEVTDIVIDETNSFIILHCEGKP